MAKVKGQKDDFAPTREVVEQTRTKNAARRITLKGDVGNTFAVIAVEVAPKNLAAAKTALGQFLALCEQDARSTWVGAADADPPVGFEYIPGIQVVGTVRKNFPKKV